MTKAEYLQILERKSTFILKQNTRYMELRPYGVALPTDTDGFLDTMQLYIMQKVALYNLSIPMHAPLQLPFFIDADCFYQMLSSLKT